MEGDAGEMGRETGADEHDPRPVWVFLITRAFFRELSVSLTFCLQRKSARNAGKASGKVSQCKN